jgi:type VI secretion system secreted protein Hcp
MTDASAVPTRRRALTATVPHNLGLPIPTLTPKKDCSLLLVCLVVPAVNRMTDLWSIQMASDIFAKIGDIKGESLDSKHKDEVEVLSFSWGVTNDATIKTGGGSGAGKATFHDLSFVHAIDKASPGLLKACATGSHLKEATITHRKAGKGQQEYLIIKMNDVIITGVSLSDSSDAGGSENVTMAFAKVDFEYKPQNSAGSLDPGIHFKYDIKANKEG